VRCILHAPVRIGRVWAAAWGAAAGLGVVIFEIRIKRVSLTRLIGAAIGSVLGISECYLISLVLGHALPNSYNTIPFLQVVLFGVDDLLRLGGRRREGRTC